MHTFVQMAGNRCLGRSAIAFCRQDSPLEDASYHPGMVIRLLRRKPPLEKFGVPIRTTARS